MKPVQRSVEIGNFSELGLVHRIQEKVCDVLALLPALEAALAIRIEQILQIPVHQLIEPHKERECSLAVEKSCALSHLPGLATSRLTENDRAILFEQVIPTQAIRL